MHPTKHLKFQIFDLTCKWVRYTFECECAPEWGPLTAHSNANVHIYTDSNYIHIRQQVWYVCMNVLMNVNTYINILNILSMQGSYSNNKIKFQYIPGWIEKHFQDIYAVYHTRIAINMFSSV